MLSAVVALSCSIAAPSASAELEPQTLAAYEQYADEAKQAFLRRIQNDESGDRTATAQRIRDGEVVARPARGDGITDLSGGLVHHWLGAAFIPGATIDGVLAVSQDYESYAAMHRPIIASTLLGRDGDTYRVLIRVKEDAGIVSAVLDVWSVVTYTRGTGRAHAIGDADDIREVEDAGESDERRLPPGRGSGYLWRADTFTSFANRDGGVYVELETIGLSRGFPQLLGWIIEPIARRLGRGSVEVSLREFRDAVLDDR